MRGTVMYSAGVLRRVAGVVLAMLAVAGSLAALEVPYLSGRVNDYGNLLSPETETQLESRLAALEEATGAQVAVLTIDSLEGEPLEDFSIEVVEAWKLGREGVDDGVLFLVAKNDRMMRLEVGYGLEGSLTDALSRQIIANVTTPHFKSGDFDGGVAATVEAVDGVLRGREDAVPVAAVGQAGNDLGWPGRAFAFIIFALVVGTFSLTAAASSGCGSWFLYVFLMPFWGVFPTAIFGPPGIVALVLWVVGFPLLKLWTSKSTAGQRFIKRMPMHFPMGAGGWSSRGGGFSGGGFSGGGGSFGGGGASGSW